MIILIIHTIARMRDPKAIDPIWYLNRLYRLFLIGLSTFLLLTPSPSVKYHRLADEAIMKNPVAIMNSIFQINANMLKANWYLTFSFHLIDPKGDDPFWCEVP